MICFEEVTIAAGSGTLLDALSLSIGAGAPTVLIGPNGAGKTSLLRAAMGLLEPTRGRIAWDGEPRRAIVFQRPVMLRRSAAANIRFAQVGADRTTELLALVGLAHAADRPARRLSAGEQQRLALARALARDPAVLFLDEPTVGLDVEARRLMWTQIRDLVSRGKTVLLTTHYLNEADALADRILVLQHGTIVAEGTPSEIKSRAIGKQVRFSSRLTLDEVRAIPGVLTAAANRQKFELQVQAAEPVVRELLNRDSWLSDLEVTSAGLEEAFLALTQNHHSNGSN